MELDIDAVRTEIAAAPTITLEAEVDFKSGTPEFTIEGYGFTTTATENGQIGAHDATTPATILAETYEASALTGTSVITFDVTSIVKADGPEGATTGAASASQHPTLSSTQATART